MADAIVEVTETGSSLRANNLRILEEILQSTTRLIANKESLEDEWKKTKLTNIALMLQSCLAAEGKVGLMMNVTRDDLEKVLEVLPSLQNPDRVFAGRSCLGRRQHNCGRIGCP